MRHDEHIYAPSEAIAESHLASWSDTYGLSEYCALIGSPRSHEQRPTCPCQTQELRRQRLLNLLLYRSLRRAKLSAELQQQTTSIPLANLSNSRT